MVIKTAAKLAVQSAGKRSKFVNRILKKRGQKKRDLKYSEISESFKHDNKSVVFMSFMGRQYSDSPKAIFAEMVNDEKYSEWRFVWALKKSAIKRCRIEKKLLLSIDNIVKLPPAIKSYLEQLNRMEIVKYRSEQHYLALAESKYWVSNSRIPDEVIPKKGQIYLQTWHGTPLKRLGADIENDNPHPTRSNVELQEWYTLEAKKWTYALAQNEYGARIMSSAFNLKDIGKENVVLTEGYPRNDYLSTYNNEEIKRVKSALGIPTDKKIALYAPTYRDDQHNLGDGYGYSLGCDFEKLQEQLGQEWVVLFRAHYFVARNFNFSEFEGFIHDVSGHDDINELYILSDVLITDYSSMFFDYVNLQRPIIFYMYDLDHYVNSLRGLYLTLEELPGEVIEDEDSLIDRLDNFSSYREKWGKRAKSFSNKYNVKDDGEVSKRVLSEIIDKEDI